MNLASLEKLLTDRIGLDVGSIGAATLSRTVTTRMAARGLTSPEAYASRCAEEAAEWAALVDELVVAESWFFRGGVSFFEYLARWTRTKLTDAPNGRTLRCLSVPCSTGEEPYSLAIAFEREGVPAARCTIDGVDIARDHLLRAVAGRFPAFSFREANSDPRPRHFREVEPGKWELRPEIRERVHFRSGNLVDPGFLAGESPYNLILCRNLFIYLTADGAARAMANLERLLAPDGLLCLTAAEADRIPVAKFVPDGPASLAIFRKYTGDVPRSGGVLGLDTKPRAPVAPVSDWGSIGPVRDRAHQLWADTAAAKATPTVKSGIGRAPVPDPLHEARRLADAGNLEAARAACETAPASSSRFSLLGVIHLAAGRTEAAAEAFRRALYLNPDDAEALTHSIVLCEQRGEHGQAAGLRSRLNRVEKGASR